MMKSIGQQIWVERSSGQFYLCRCLSSLNREDFYGFKLKNLDAQTWAECEFSRRETGRPIQAVKPYLYVPDSLDDCMAILEELSGAFITFDDEKPFRSSSDICYVNRSKPNWWTQHTVNKIPQGRLGYIGLLYTDAKYSAALDQYNKDALVAKRVLIKRKWLNDDLNCQISLGVRLY